MPALFIVMEIDRPGDPGFGLEPGHVGGEDVFAAGAGHFAEGDDRRHQGHRRMAADGGRHVVKIEGMGSGAVDQPRVQRTGAGGAAEHQARTAAVADAVDAIQDTDAFLP